MGIAWNGSSIIWGDGGKVSWGCVPECDVCGDSETATPKQLSVTISGITLCACQAGIYRATWNGWAGAGTFTVTQSSAFEPCQYDAIIANGMRLERWDYPNEGCDSEPDADELLDVRIRVRLQAFGGDPGDMSVQLHAITGPSSFTWGPFWGEAAWDGDCGNVDVTVSNIYNDSTWCDYLVSDLGYGGTITVTNV